MDDPRLQVAIDYTPEKLDMKSLYKYYCPICMMYFTEIQKTECCENYICQFCASDILVPVVNNMHSSTIECPYCTRPSVSFLNVNKQEKIKCYIDEENVQCSECSDNTEKQMSHSPFNSPLKFSDSYADMRRKLVPFETTLKADWNIDYSDLQKPVRDIHSAPLYDKKRSQAEPVNIRDLFIKSSLSNKKSIQDTKESKSTNRPTSAPIIIQRKQFHTNRIYPALPLKFEDTPETTIKPLPQHTSVTNKKKQKCCSVM
jgi:hypothetical protein